MSKTAIPNNKFKAFFAFALIFSSITFLVLTIFKDKDNVSELLNIKIQQEKTKEEKVEIFDFDGLYHVKNYLSDSERLKNSNSQQIFFIESHLEGHRNLSSPKQACSIESAARINPNLDIYLLLMTDQDEVVLDQTPQLEVLLSYPNIRIRFANITEFTRGTILEEFFKENKVQKSNFRLAHTSDIMRMLVLNKFGGLYLDHDVLSLYPVKLIPDKNFACMEKPNQFNNAIIRLDKIEGKKYTDVYLEKVANNYNPNSWPANGPELVTESFKTYCNETTLDMKKTSKCDKITAWAAEKCFLYMWYEYQMFYEEKYKDESLRKMATIGGFFIHIWNSAFKFNKKTYTLSRDSKALYMELAETYCPKAIETTNFL
ncbi:hypothetical protein PVAND_000366 [Polypedilum vanderplanki]|uniref:Alpha 1,4-glycosyltransferase domain-containing protein n=1 Tax=Polypedilum vanderplanki TaxID=319348 RepID=A0A9J6BJL9_POLVA|nr:hypothetical protein PVAND_000366 [Polypedilum vanderplanki]